MATPERRLASLTDRRRVPRGGRRPTDRAGRYPPVLVADSDGFARRPLVSYLKLFGFQVDEAANSHDATAAIERSQPHVIIAELTLPASARLRTLFTSARCIPVIVTTTDTAIPVSPQASGLLMKPFPLATLLDELRGVLRQLRIAADGVLGEPEQLRPL
jgi:DNA-binding response OmpR family regulator